MPFVSQAQRRFLFATAPAVARRYAEHTPKGAKLPERKVDTKEKEAPAAKSASSLCGYQGTLTADNLLALSKQSHWRTYLVSKQADLAGSVFEPPAPPHEQPVPMPGRPIPALAPPLQSPGRQRMMYAGTSSWTYNNPDQRDPTTGARTIGAADKVITPGNSTYQPKGTNAGGVMFTPPPAPRPNNTIGRTGLTGPAIAAQPAVGATSYRANPVTRPYTTPNPRLSPPATTAARTGQPPMVKRNSDGLDVTAAFKSGFLLRCFEEGLNPEQISGRVKAALDKSAGWADAVKYFLSPASNIATTAGSKYLDWVGAGLIGAPLAAGAALGYGAGKLRNAADSESADTLKLENRVQQYRQLADAAARQAKLKQLQDKHPGELVQIG